MDDHGSVALRRVLEKFADHVEETHAQHGDATVRVRREAIRKLGILCCGQSWSCSGDSLHT